MDTDPAVVRPDYPIEPTLARLIAAHPRLFRGQAPICWSDLPAGWCGIVDELCSGIESALAPEDLARFEVRQIKQKLGGLRFYWRLGCGEGIEAPGAEEPDRSSAPDLAPSPTENVIRALVAAADAKSLRTCERCGSPGQLRNDAGLLATLCEQPHGACVDQR